MYYVSMDAGYAPPLHFNGARCHKPAMVSCMKRTPILVITVWMSLTVVFRAMALDQNGDGMSDVWQSVYGIDIAEALLDPDGDGESNIRESLVGTNPDDPQSNSSIAIAAATPTNVVLTWLGIDGKHYEVQVSVSMSAWIGLPPLEGTGGVAQASAPADDDTSLFRVQYLADPDTDLDGLLDWEEGILGSDPAGLDGDGDGVPDMHEYLKGFNPGDSLSIPAAAWYVNAAATPGGDGSAGLPFDTIQAALDAAADLDIIELADGVYSGVGNRDLRYRGTSLLLRSTNGAENCIIDGGETSRGFTFNGGETELAVLSGVTIRNGFSGTGGGLSFSGSSSPTIWNCLIMENIGNSDGGGAQITSSSPIFDGCVFRGNRAVGDDGGGLIIGSSSQPLFRNCRIVDNQAKDDGGGLYNVGTTAAPTFLYCVITGNSCGDDGGAMYNSSSSPKLINCTVADNQAGPTTGGAMFNSSSTARPFIENSVLWGNTPNQIQGGQSTVLYSIVQGGFPGTGNVDADPLLTDLYRLTAASLCIDAGSSSNTLPVDPDGEAHFDDPLHSNIVSIVDMGADEFVDTDADELADVWEARFLGDLNQSAGMDGDLDTLTNIEEYNLGTDPDESDTDGDGLEDGQEVNVYGTLPLQADSDGDVMTDGQEIAFGLNPLDAVDQMDDPDSDQVPNLYELVHGSNPTNGASVPAPTLHVDASALPGGDGSPGMPFNAIQDALDAAVAYDIVQAADGIYTGTANRNLDFNGKPVMLRSTNGAANCIIDCETGGRGVLFNDKEDQRTLVQGLTIRNGSNSSGGGLSILSDCSPLIRECRIENCRATSSTGGAGMYCVNSNPILDRCTISDNVSNGDGGGVYTGSNASPLFRHCRIVGNQAGDDGGGVMIPTSSATPEFYSCIIANNEANDDGGGLYNNNADPRLINCTVAGNRAGPSTGGGLFNNGGDPVLENCILWTNIPNQITGGFPVISYSAVQGGAAGTGNLSIDPVLTPLTFRLTAGSPAIDAGNDANAPLLDVDGEARVDDPGLSNVVSIVDMGADEFVDTDGDQLADAWELEHFPDLTGAPTHDVDADGLDALQEFLNGGDPNDPDTDNDGLLDGEEILVYGTSLFLADTDEDLTSDGWEITHGLDPLDPGDRIDDPDGDRIPNVYEFVYATDPTNSASFPMGTVFVDAAASPGGDGTAGTPFDTIQEGLDAAADHDIVAVADGQYTGSGNFNLDFNGVAALLLSAGGASNCVIDCQQNGRGFSFSDDEDDRSVVDGFTVRNGSFSVGGAVDCNASSPTLRGCILRENQSTSFSSTTGGGGGIRCVNASPLIQHCTIVSNRANGSGAGIFLVTSSSPRIESCRIEGNSCSNITFGGGGILMSSGSPVVRHCTIISNTARGDGGGIYRLNTAALIENCVIEGNSSDDKGGGIYTASSSGMIRTSRLTQNRAKNGGGMSMLNASTRIENSAFTFNEAEDGGGLHHENSDPQILHTTFLMNQASGAGGGIYNSVSSGPGVYNSILWGNLPDQINASSGSPVVNHCDVEGGWPGEGNIDADPLLTRHHRLNAGSPCVDAGSATNSLPADIDGEARWDSPAATNAVSAVDIGWDEFVDTDADALADHWEVDRFGNLSRTAFEDSDAQGGADGLTNLEEYQQDTDPNDADTDADMLVDGDEVNTYMTDPLDLNTDGDRLDDGVEVSIGSDPLDPFDIKIANLTATPFNFDPEAGSARIDFDLNRTGEVEIVFYRVFLNIDFLGNMLLTFDSDPARTLAALLPPGSNTVFWDGRDEATNFVASAAYTFTIEATNEQGLVTAFDDPRETYMPYEPSVIDGLLLNEGELGFWRNERGEISYSLSAPAFVAMAPLVVAYPVVWGEARPHGHNVEIWDGWGGTATPGEGQLYQPEFFTLYARTLALPDNTVNVHYPPNVISNMSVEIYLVIPRYAEVTRIEYSLIEDAITDVSIQDPSGNFLTVLDPVLQPAGVHSVEWHGGADSNTLVHAEGDYRVTVTAVGAASQRTHEKSANVTVRNR
jgi:parallel beta-helix repeat protein